MYDFSTAGGGGGRREAVKIGRSRVSLKSLIDMAHNGFPLGADSAPHGTPRNPPAVEPALANGEGHSVAV